MEQQQEQQQEEDDSDAMEDDDDDDAVDDDDDDDDDTMEEVDIHSSIQRPLPQGVGGDEDQQRRLSVNLGENVARQSVRYLVDFLRSRDAHQVTELVLCEFKILQPSDGGLDVLCDFLSNQVTLTKVRLLHGCNFGSEQEASRLLVAFQTNTTVTDLTFYGIRNLDGAVYGNCISGLLLNMPQLQRLELFHDLDTEAIRALQPGLRTTNRNNLTILDLSYSRMRDEGLHVLVDALVGNTTIKELNISRNRITSNGGLDDITRLLESTQLQKVDFGANFDVFNDDDASTRFAQGLARSPFLTVLDIRLIRFPGSAFAKIFQALESNTVLEHLCLCAPSAGQQATQLIESLPRIKGLKRLSLEHWSFYVQHHASFLPALHQNTSLEEAAQFHNRETTLDVNNFPPHRHVVVSVNNTLTRNRSLRRATALLQLQPGTALPIRSKRGLWCRAFDKWGKATPGGSEHGLPLTWPGASAIFKVLQARPAILEKQLKRPASSNHHHAGDASRDTNDAPSSEAADGRRKRPRL
jgi:Leucine Rich repeat